MNYCNSCGRAIPDNQTVCSMCYGDIGYGNDGYYEQWARERLESDMRDALEDEREAHNQE